MPSNRQTEKEKGSKAISNSAVRRYCRLDCCHRGFSAAARLALQHYGTPSKPSGSDTVRISRLDASDAGVPPTAEDLEEEAGDFIAPYVLDKDSRFFEG